MTFCLVLLFAVSISTFIELGVAERHIRRLEEELDSIKCKWGNF